MIFDLLYSSVIPQRGHLQFFHILTITINLPAHFTFFLLQNGKLMPNQIMPFLGSGTFRLQGDIAYYSVLQSLKLGYRHIDTAQIYGNEKEVGDAIRDSGIPRKEIFLTTKVWIDRFTKESFLPSVKESLEKLQTPYVDLLLIHWPSPKDRVAMDEYLNELMQIKEQGFSRHIGISNFTISQTAQAINILGEGEILTNQIEVHPYLQNSRLVNFCQERDILVTGYMPFAVGKVLMDETIVAIAEKHQATAAQVVLAWLRQKDIATIPSSTKEKNLKSNLEATKLVLDAEDMTAIGKLDCNDRQANPDFSPEWD